MNLRHSAPFAPTSRVSCNTVRISARSGAPATTATFDLNGKNIEGPPPKPLEEYVVNVRSDQIVASKRG